MHLRFKPTSFPEIKLPSGSETRLIDIMFPNLLIVPYSEQSRVVGDCADDQDFIDVKTIG